MAEKIKVVLFTDTFCDINGVSRFIQDISRLAVADTLEFYVFTSTLKPCPDIANIYNFTPKYKIKMPFYPDLDMVYPPAKAMKEKFHEISPDVVHISTPGMVGMVGRKLARKHKLPMIGTYHTDFPGFVYKNLPLGIVRMISNKVMEHFYKGFDGMFVRSEAYREIVYKDVKLAQDTIHTLKAGIDIEKFNRSYKDMGIWEGYGIPEDATKALYVGRLTKEKNFPLLIELWKAYFERSENKNIYLIALGGELPDEPYNRYNIKALGVKRGLELSKLYSSSDLFLFPSTTDTLGQVVMEAMSSGLPVVVSDLGGPKTLVDEAEGSGYAIDVNDREAWLEALDKLVKNKDMRDQMGEIGSRYIAKKGISESFKAFWNTHVESAEKNEQK